MYKLKPPKHILVAWSGGLDSTGLIHQLLKEGNKVSALPILLRCNEYKNKRETKAREKIAEHLSKWFRGRFTLLEPTEVHSKNLFECLAFVQVMPWLYGLVANVTNEIDEVSIGYVMGDQAISYEKEIVAIWNSFNGLAFSGVSLPPLTFPLTKNTKNIIAQSMPKELVDNVVWCEEVLPPSEESRYCGVCIPCRRLNNENLLDLFGIVADQTTPNNKKVVPEMKDNLKKFIKKPSRKSKGK